MSALKAKLARRFEKLPFTQKILSCIMLVVVLYMAWGVVIDQSLSIATESSLESARGLKEKIAEIKSQINLASEAIKSNPRQGLKEQVEVATKEGVLLDKKIHDKTTGMVSPKDMNKVLQQVIQQSQGLTVTKMESLERKILVQAKKTDDTKTDGSEKSSTRDDAQKNTDKTVGSSKNNNTIFEHGLLLEMSGGYFETLDFLNALEKRHLNVVWDEITYTVTKYPNATIKIIVHTLSLDEDWIGV